MTDIMWISEGKVDSSVADKWCALYWLNNGDYSGAVRQKTDDGWWYVTTGFAPDETIVHGPYPSKEAIEILIATGLLEGY
jgi:hypothetical protein